MDTKRLERLRRSLQLALDHEWPQLDRTCRKVARLDPVRVEPEAGQTRRIVATVATDGGEGRLSLQPIHIRVIRVADSDGTIYFEDFIPQSLTPEEIVRLFFAGQERFVRLLDYLGVGWEDLLPRSDYQKGNLIGMLRELLEWAAMIRLAHHKRPLLLVRDGLLRSVLLPERVFAALKRRLMELTRLNNHLLAGVAKRSAVLSYLSVGLGVKDLFPPGEPMFAAIPEELEKEAAPSQYRWVGERTMGRLFVARLDRGDGVPLMPLDVAGWQADAVAEIATLLHGSARASFPLRGYPQELILAHQHARLGEFETHMLEGLLMEQILDRNPEVAEQVRQLRLLGRRFIEDLTDERQTRQ